MFDTIRINYTNDFHSHFENWPRVATYIKQRRENAFRNNIEHCLVDIGDHADRVSPITEATNGKANVDMLNDLNYDVVTLGNNEGITLAHQELYELYEHANFEVTCANLDNAIGDNPKWLKRTATIVTKENTHIAFIGLTAAFYTFYERLGWNVIDPYQVLARELKRLKKDHDILILLSHLGLLDDEAIAATYSEIDVIIGGHTHHLLKTGKVINNTLITAAGKLCNYVGEVNLIFDKSTQTIVEKEAHAVRIEHLKKDKATSFKLEKISREAMKIMNRPIKEVANRYEVDWFKSTELIELLTVELKEWTNADCAMLNAGVLLESLEEGVVTFGDIHRTCPHPINPCVVELDGDALLEVIRGAHVESLINFPLQGFGFRGKIIGVFVFSDLEIIYEQIEEENYFIKDALLNGDSLQGNKTYRLATADTFTFGDLFPEIRRATVKNFYMPEFLRDLLLKVVQTKM